MTSLCRAGTGQTTKSIRGKFAQVLRMDRPHMCRLTDTHTLHIRLNGGFPQTHRPYYRTTTNKSIVHKNIITLLKPQRQATVCFSDAIKWGLGIEDKVGQTNRCVFICSGQPVAIFRIQAGMHCVRTFPR